MEVAPQLTQKLLVDGLTTRLRQITKGKHGKNNQSSILDFPKLIKKLGFLSSLIRENSNFIATSFQISLWNPRINTHLFSINSFILYHNLLSQHKSFGRWTIGEQKDLHQNGISAKVGRVPTELRRFVKASSISASLSLVLRLHASLSPITESCHLVSLLLSAKENISGQSLKPIRFWYFSNLFPLYQTA